ncbi:hypothetical protein FUAX_02130 [Fulvitalea axinellae]|uniref:Uncharacterized protein n=1 Tax=Fulvitalea axinellae TaxID=1182444 RepID=A0AAU9D4P2_9BACT|nr:hypothetical protein FUAX_02130 [Fulvitalea axinellae]
MWRAWSVSVLLGEPENIKGNKKPEPFRSELRFLLDTFIFAPLFGAECRFLKRDNGDFAPYHYVFAFGENYVEHTAFQFDFFGVIEVEPFGKV